MSQPSYIDVPAAGMNSASPKREAFFLRLHQGHIKANNKLDFSSCKRGKLAEGLVQKPLEEIFASKLNHLYNQVTFGKYYATGRSLEHYMWKVWQSPAGQPVGSVIFNEDGDAIASYSLAPRRAWANGRSVLTYEACESMVHEDYRDQNLFRELGAHCLEQLRDRRGIIAFGLDDDLHMSKAGRRIFGFKQLARMGAWECDLTVDSNPIVAAENNLELKKVERIGTSFDRLWRRHRNSSTFLLDRSSSHLYWRFERCPVAKHETYMALRDGVEEGYVVVRYTEEDGKQVAKVMDLFPGSDLEVAVALLRKARSAAVEAGSEVLRCESLPQTKVLEAMNLIGDFIPTLQGVGKPVLALPLKSSFLEDGDREAQLCATQSNAWFMQSADCIQLD